MKHDVHTLEHQLTTLSYRSTRVIAQYKANIQCTCISSTVVARYKVESLNYQLRKLVLVVLTVLDLLRSLYMCDVNN